VHKDGERRACAEEVLSKPEREEQGMVIEVGAAGGRVQKGGARRDRHTGGSSNVRDGARYGQGSGWAGRTEGAERGVEDGIRLGMQDHGYRRIKRSAGKPIGRRTEMQKRGARRGGRDSG